MTLVIGITNRGAGDAYYAITDDGGVAYRIVGRYPADQLTSLEKLANYMRAGQSEVLQSLGNVVELGDVQTEAAVNELYVANDALDYAGAPIYSVFDGRTLWDTVVEAGEALIAALGV